MGLAEKRKKDQAMAAYMKAHGIRRVACRCPICHTVVGLSSIYYHICSCKGVHVRTHANPNRGG